MSWMIPVETDTPFRVYPLLGHDLLDRQIVTVIVKGTFGIVADRRATWAAAQLPIAEWDEYNDSDNPRSVRTESDLVPFKPRADVILVGKAHAPEGKPVSRLVVSLKVGQLEQSIAVVGDRRWIAGGSDELQISEPELFVEMALVYERAFGGMDLDDDYRGEWSDENPVGVGLISKARKAQAVGRPLPNLEDPADPIHSWEDVPKPRCFGCYGRGWKPRVEHAGTYDEQWRSERDPKLPLDFRQEYYNCAHPDLQLAGFLAGTEQVELSNLSASSPRIAFKLPGITPVVTMDVERPVQGKGKSTTALENESLNVNLDTLHLFPEEDLFTLVWRGVYSSGEQRVSGIRVSI